MVGTECRRTIPDERQMLERRLEVLNVRYNQAFLDGRFSDMTYLVFRITQTEYQLERVAP